jgi:O-antigen ligase
VGMILLGYLVVIVLAMVLGRSQLAGRAVPFFNDSPNALATPTVFLVPFVCYFALQQWRRGRWISVVAGGGAVTYLFMWALTASASRGATAAVIVSLVLFWGLGHDARPTLHGVLRVAVIVAVVGGLVAIAFTTSAFPDKLKDRIERTFDPEEDRELTEGRVALNRAGMQAFLESPFVGTGSNNFRYVAQFYDDEATFHEPHNLWIQFLAQTGLVGAGAFAFIIVRWFVLVVRARSVAEERSDRELLAAFIAAWVGIMAQSSVAPLVLHRHYWLLYGLGIAAAVVIGRDVRATRTEGSEFLLHQP